jgi:hypothetical protein
MVEVDATTPVIGPDGPVTLLEAFEGRPQPRIGTCGFPGRPAAPYASSHLAARSSTSAWVRAP